MKEFFRGFLPGITLLLLTGVLGLVLVRLLQMDTSIPVASDDVEAAARSNERMLQMIQWTLSAIIGLGLALIGVSWFNSTRDRAEVTDLRAQAEDVLATTEQRLNEREHELQERLIAADRRLVEISSALDRMEIRRIKQELVEEQINHSGPHHPSTPAYCAQVFETEVPGTLRQQAAAELMLESCIKGHPNTVDAHHALERVLPKLKQYDPALAVEALEILNSDLRLAPRVRE